MQQQIVADDPNLRGISQLNNQRAMQELEAQHFLFDVRFLEALIQI
jgi:hypothetical protein